MIYKITLDNKVLQYRKARTSASNKNLYNNMSLNEIYIFSQGNISKYTYF